MLFSGLGETHLDETKPHYSYLNGEMYQLKHRWQVGYNLNNGGKMKRIMIKYTIEIPEDRLDKYCNKVNLTRNAAKKLIKEMAEVYGRTHTFEYIDETINTRR